MLEGHLFTNKIKFLSKLEFVSNSLPSLVSTYQSMLSDRQEDQPLRLSKNEIKNNKRKDHNKSKGNHFFLLFKFLLNLK